MTRPECHCTQGNHARSTRHGDQMAVCYWALDPHHTPSHHSLMLRSQSLHPTRIHPPPTDGCACALAHTRTLNHINDKLHAHDIWSLHAGLAWVSHLHAFFFFFLWVRVVGGSSETKKERKAPSSPLPVYETPAYTIVYFSWTPRYVSVQPFIRCVFIDIIDNKTQSFFCSWRRRLVRGRRFDQMTDKLCCAECCYHISKNVLFMQLSSYSDWHYLKSAALEPDRRFSISHKSRVVITPLLLFFENSGIHYLPAITSICYFKRWCWQCCCCC